MDFGNYVLRELFVGCKLRPTAL